LIREGDIVNQETAYFYLLYRGTCCFTINDKVVGAAQPGDSFGELALLYDCPRAATVTAVTGANNNALSANVMEKTKDLVASATSTTAKFTPSSSASSVEPPRDDQIRGIILFRVHQRTFRRVLQQADQSAEETKLNLLNSVAFLKDVSRVQKQKLAAAMKPRPFKKGEYLLRKGETKCEWTLIGKGSVLATNVSVAGEDADSKHGWYEDLSLGEGNCFGERAISTGMPTMADLIAETDGIAFVVDRETFLGVLGNLQDAILRSLDNVKLLAIQVIVNTTQQDERMHSYLASKIEDMSFPKGTVICREGEPLLMDAALYLVRKGEIKISAAAEEDEVVGMDSYFGADQLKADTVGRSKFKATYTAVVISDCVCGVLKLESFRRIIDTHKMGKPQNINELDSIRIGDVSVNLDNLKLYRILGAGTFGQVWLVSRTGSDGTLRPYALKVQSKHELCASGQAHGVVREKNIMSQFHNPFVAGLVSSFQDGERVYMIMPLLQGGELHSIMHNSRSDVLSERDARFYLACIAEGLGYMHRHLFVYRDLKPEVGFFLLYFVSPFHV
jgi:CRP-like cAMP-binding protein